MDMDESSQVHIIFGRPLLATAGAVNDMQALCGKGAEFRLPPPTAPPAPTTLPVYACPTVLITPLDISRSKLVDGDGTPQRRFSAVFERHPSSLPSFGGTFVRHRELVVTSPVTTSSTPPTSLSPLVI